MEHDGMRIITLTAYSATSSPYIQQITGQKLIHDFEATKTLAA